MRFLYFYNKNITAASSISDGSSCEDVSEKGDEGRDKMSGAVLPEETPEDTVFLTQVDDQEAEPDNLEPTKDLAEKEDNCPLSADIISYTASTVNIPDKFQGYEEFLDVDDDPEDIIPDHIQSAVKSLRRALNKTLILPDVYKPVSNSSKQLPKYKYTSYKV